MNLICNTPEGLHIGKVMDSKKEVWVLNSDRLRYKSWLYHLILKKSLNSVSLSFVIFRMMEMGLLPKLL